MLKQAQGHRRARYLAHLTVVCLLYRFPSSVFLSFAISFVVDLELCALLEHTCHKLVISKGNQ